MKVVVLGTGTSQGVPVIGCQCSVCISENQKDKRLRVSIWVEVDDTYILIDIGPDFRMQMLKNELTKVDAVLVTHEHNDHTAGVDDIRPINFHYKKDLPFFGLPRVLDQLRQRFSYAFEVLKYPGAPEVALIPTEGTPFHVKDTLITPIHVMHGQLPILGYRIGDLAYLTDVKSIPVSEYDKLKGLKVLILSALRKGPEHTTHLTLVEALHMIKEISPESAYLTHLSHKMGLHDEIVKELPPGVFLAYDTLTIDIK